jgi:uracil-DNA glycosylase family 4
MEFLFKKWKDHPINRNKNSEEFINKKEKKILLEEINLKINQEEENKEKVILDKNILNTYIKDYPPELVNIFHDIEKLNCKIPYKNTIIGEGNFKSPIMFIGEYPENDLSLIEKMLNKIGLKKENVYFSYIFFWNKDSNTTSKKEIEETIPLVVKHILLHNPKIIIILGAVTTKSLLNITGITSLRGKYTSLHLNNEEYPVFITYNPSYVSKLNKYKEYEEDFHNLKNYLIKFSLI